LTPRTVQDRRVGYDISFHAPKSVSILYALGKDDRVIEVFRQAVNETMIDLEIDMQTRIRVQGQDLDRDTGELLYAYFMHQTARPVAGKALDPHLHCHCFAFNVTYDGEEERFKAGQFHDIKMDMPYHQARFQKRLADKLSGLGYTIRRTRDAFEASLVPQKAIDFFSKRTNLIGQVAKEQGITDPQELDKLGAITRAPKSKNLTMAELRSVWKRELRQAGIDDNEREEKGTKDINLTPQKAVKYACDHLFTRASVKGDRQILSEATRYMVDNDQIDLEDLEKAYYKDQDLFRIQDGKRELVTTLPVQKEERDMVYFARRFKGEVRPMSEKGAKDLPDTLNP